MSEVPKVKKFHQKAEQKKELIISLFNNSILISLIILYN